MCGYCARELNPELIDRLRNELPDNVVSTGDTNNPGNAALVNANAAVASGGLQLNDAGISFRPAEGGPSNNAWVGDDAFVFSTPVPVTENGTSNSFIGLKLSNLMEQEVSSLSLQTTEAPETLFWTYHEIPSFEDWIF